VQEVGSDDDEERPARRVNLGSWETLGWMAARMSRRAPGVEFL
jgi:hypothetical protein